MHTYINLCGSEHWLYLVPLGTGTGFGFGLIWFDFFFVFVAHLGWTIMYSLRVRVGLSVERWFDWFDLHCLVSIVCVAPQPCIPFEWVHVLTRLSLSHPFADWP